MGDRVAGSPRERKKALTRQRIQAEALRLFAAKGYDRTTVEEIASAAGVSHMTFFRYFPTKEDVVMADEYDATLVDELVRRPPDEPLIEKIRRSVLRGLEPLDNDARAAVLARTRLIIRTPELRARLWEQQAATERLIAEALAAGPGRHDQSLPTRVVVAAALAALTTALLVWAESDDPPPLPDLVDQAFAALQESATC